MDHPSIDQSTLVIDQTTILSLFTTLALLGIAYITSTYALSSQISFKHRVFYVWHFFDSLIHFLLEGSFLYNCFFTYTNIPITNDFPHPASLASPGVYFLGHRDRLYGNQYGTNPAAKLWQEYAKADRRWGGTDLTVISLELLTVCLAGPLAAYICELMRRDERGGKLWFWATVLATGELYGGDYIFDNSPLLTCCQYDMLTLMQ